ncbi:MAG: hypothetical protein ACRDRU_01785 [Pseudonocardiaceae bacterium]
MTLRWAPDRIGRPVEPPPEQLHGTRHARTTLDPAVLADPAFAFFGQLHLGSGRSNHHTTRSTAVAQDGSWVQAQPATRPTVSSSVSTAPTTPGRPSRLPTTPGPSSANPHPPHSGSPSLPTSNACGARIPTVTGPTP